jgi:photosystem II stability/assembly factor-like uncharacterized protein
MANRDIVTTGFSRLFLMRGGAGPNVKPEYEGQWKAMEVQQAFGDVKLIHTPSRTQLDQFDTTGKIVGEQGVAQLTVQARYADNLSEVLAICRSGCDSDVQVHFGQCKNPTDFNGGWEKILVVTNARIPTYKASPLGALEPSERALIMEDVAFHGIEVYEIARMLYQDTAVNYVLREVVDLAICDAPNCGGDCGSPTDGCQYVYAATKNSGGSPGLLAEVIATPDGGSTWKANTINGMASNQNPSALLCSAANLVVISADAGALFYATTQDLQNQAASPFAKVTTGIVTGGEPRNAWAYGPSFTWMVGNGGYIYFTSDPTQGLSVQDAGNVTSSQLNAVNGLDANTLVAVGNNGAVVFTRNGGITWAVVPTAPTNANLTAVAMISENVWWVGSDTGHLYFTFDGGSSWEEKNFPGSGAGKIHDIAFVNTGSPVAMVGYMAYETNGGVGRIYRTISGGNSWYIAPEDTSKVPTAARFNSVAVCQDPNRVFAGGVFDTSSNSAGVLVKGAA